MRPAPRVAVLFAAFGVLAIWGPGQATAQPPPYPQQGGARVGAAPTYSPYLNLLRPNAPLYQNYYGLVRPQMEFRNSIFGLQQQVDVNSQGISQIEGGGGQVVTGHRAGFQNHMSYFMTIRGGTQGLGTGGVGGVGGGRPTLGGGGGGGGTQGQATPPPSRR